MTTMDEIMGCFPFAPDRKKPKHIRKSEYIDAIYPSCSGIC